jgi:hypothetical protein
LSQFNLGAGMRCTGATGKYVEDKIGAVNDTAVELLLNVAHLAGSQLIIKDGQSDLILSHESGYLLNLSLVDEGAGIGMLNTLQE